MKNIIVSVALAAFALLPVACNNKQEGGIPGTDDKFTLKVEKSASLNQGEKKTIDVTIDRGKKFDRDIELKAEAGPDSKLKVTIDPKTIKKSDPTKATLTVEAEKDAAIKEHTVTVTATPKGEGTSAPSSVDIKVSVKEKK